MIRTRKSVQDPSQLCLCSRFHQHRCLGLLFPAHFYSAVDPEMKTGSKKPHSFQLSHDTMGGSASGLQLNQSMFPLTRNILYRAEVNKEII